MNDVAQPLAERSQQQSSGLIDCDVHPLYARGFESLYPYMPGPWRERFKRKRSHLAMPALPMRFAHPNGTVVRDDAFRAAPGLT